jgi:hypothetical protein
MSKRPPKIRRAFLLLVIAQAAHSIEEYLFRLFEVFGPARFVSGLVSDNLATGFAIINVSFLIFGIWCVMRPEHRINRGIAWFWTLLEFGNGVGHSALAASRGGYFLGVVTAPLLIGTSLYLGVKLSENCAL